MSEFPEDSSRDLSKTVYVPPPPTEVTIRTLDSDVKSMALSGGNFPKSEKLMINRGATQTGGLGIQSPRAKALIWLLVFAFLGALAYFLYPFLVKPKTTLPESSGGNVVSSTLPNVPEELTLSQFNHQTFFGGKVVETLNLEVIYPPRRIEDYDLINYEAPRLFLNKENISFSEIEIQKFTRKPLALPEFFNLAQVNWFDEDFWISNFNLDFTYFIYKNSNGFWPGLVLQLKPEKSQIVMDSQIRKIETGEDLFKLFITQPKERSGIFQSVLISGEPARSLKLNNSDANFVYGWFHNYLVISTSLTGLEEAIKKL